MLLSATITAAGGEFARNTVWAEGSTFSPYVSVLYEHRFRSGIALRAGGAVGTLTVRIDNPWFGNPTVDKKETFFSVPVSIGYCVGVSSGEHFIEPSLTLQGIVSPTQFYHSDYGDESIVCIAPGLLLGWRYEPDNSRLSFKASGGAYILMGYTVERNKPLYPWLGLGVGWRF